MVGVAVTEYRRDKWQGQSKVGSSLSETASWTLRRLPIVSTTRDDYLGSLPDNLSIYPFFMNGDAST